MSESQAELPEPAIKTKRRFSIIWIIPVVALCVAGYLVYQTLTEKGQQITISFKTAAGIEAGKTKIKFKEIEVGKVETLSFNEDLSRIVLTAAMEKSANAFLNSGTRFWVVRPRLGVGGVEGLDTLVSGAYIQTDPGAGEAATVFEGLEVPPPVLLEDPGTEFLLASRTRGSLDPGSPIYFKGIAVGQILSVRLTEGGERIESKAFVRAPFDEYVRINSRFWNASGIDLRLDASGVRLSTESLQTILAGGITFDAPTGLRAERAVADQEFTLFPDQDSAGQRQITERVPFLMYFNSSVRGLEVGAPVEFRGIKVGEVTDLHLEVDPQDLSVRIPVELVIEPDRAVQTAARDPSMTAYDAFAVLVRRGMRGRLASGSIVTGSLFVELDFHPDEPPTTMSFDGRYPQIPTVASTLDQITTSATRILDKIGSLPLEGMIADVRGTLQSVEKLANSPKIQATLDNLSEATASLNSAMNRAEGVMAQADGEIAPVLRSLRQTLNGANRLFAEGQNTMVNVRRLTSTRGKFVGDLDAMLEELKDAARAIRLLAEYLEKNPEALISGKN